MASLSRILLLIASALVAAALSVWLGNALAAQITIPQAGVSLTIQGAIDCNDGSALVCITTLPTQRAYLLALGPDGTFIAAAYRVLLNRPADVAGLSYYTNRLTGRTITRDGVLDELIASPEYRGMHP